jgi:LPXTG-motif cell wall-anchored protein
VELTFSFRRAAAIAAACTALGLFGVAAPALAGPGQGQGNGPGNSNKSEGPGYGGGADRLDVKWKDKVDEKDKVKKTAVAINGVGFRAGSKVLLRVGSGAEISALVDAAGALTFDVPGQELALASGTSVLVQGSTPAGTQLTLVGAIPPEPTGSGAQDVVPWVVAGGALLAVSGGFIGRRRRMRY